MGTLLSPRVHGGIQGIMLHALHGSAMRGLGMALGAQDRLTELD